AAGTSPPTSREHVRPAREGAMSTIVNAPPRRATPRGFAFEPIFEGLCFGAATALLAALGGVLVSLAIGGWPAISKFGLNFITGVTWDPNPEHEVYGAA